MTQQRTSQPQPLNPPQATPTSILDESPPLINEIYSQTKDIYPESHFSSAYAQALAKMLETSRSWGEHIHTTQVSEALKALALFYKSDSAFAFLPLQQGSSQVKIGSWSRLSSRDDEILADSLTLSEYPWLHIGIANAEEVMYLESLKAFPNELSVDLANLRSRHVGSVAVAPLRISNNRVGFILLLSAKPLLIRNDSTFSLLTQTCFLLSTLLAKAHAQHEAKKTVDQLRLFVEHNLAPVAMFDKEMRYLIASKRWHEDYHLGNQNIVGRCHYDIFPNIREEWKEVHRRCLQGAVEANNEDHYINKKGEFEWLRWKVHPWFEPDGSIGGLIMFTEILTEKKRTEEVLSVIQYSIDQAAEGIFWADNRGHIQYVNNAICKLTGHAKEDLLDKKLQKLTNPFPYSIWRKHWQNIRRLGNTTVETELTRVDGLKIPIEISANYVSFEGKEFVCAFVKDISDRKRSEEELSRQRAFFRQVIDMNPNLIFAKDRTGRFTLANKAVAEIYGTTCEDLIGKRDSDFNPNDEEVDHFVEDDIHVMDSGQTKVVGEEMLTDSQGKTRWLHTVKLPLFDDKGRANQVLGVATDISALKNAEEVRRKLERDMQHAQKLESLGVLAGGISHDFNNLLMGVLGNAGLLLLELPKDSPLHPRIDQIRIAAKRAAELTNQLLAYSGKGRFVVGYIHMNSVVREMVTLLDTIISKKAKLVFHFDEEIPLIEGDVSQVRQVIMNLITNASDALGSSSGEIHVETGLATLSREESERFDLSENFKHGKFVYLTVRDSGCGMSEATLSKIFEPFFSTKFTGRGLGLSAVMGIVRGHGGMMNVNSAVGEGTTIRVFFPATKSDVYSLSTEEETSQIELPLPTGTILLADDEEATRDVSQAILRKLGFDVLVAEDGEEAVELYKKHRSKVIAVILDMTMPKMDGSEVFRALKDINDQVKVVFSSGYSELEVKRLLNTNERTTFLQKPYGPEELQLTLRELLANIA